jgi:hypothetical protein
LDGLEIRRKFNITGSCNPDRHYMVDVDAKIEAIVQDYIMKGEYFAINRARQYGKTTTLALLRRRLADECRVIKMSFEGAESYFTSIENLVEGICLNVVGLLGRSNEKYSEIWKRDVNPKFPLDDLSTRITEFCELANRGVILMIDEVDRASDYDVFSAFLGLLRKKYLERSETGAPTFQSVILAGVHDIKNLRAKIRPNAEHSYNSPWNIAAPFDIDMSFGPNEIATMLRAYEGDNRVGMDIEAVAERIYYYTGGYPFLVSRLCKTIDERPLEWTAAGVDEAENDLQRGWNTLFEDIIENIVAYPSFGNMLESILLHGQELSFAFSNPDMNLGAMFGILKENAGKAVVSNIVFETVLYNYFTSKEETKLLFSSSYTENKSLFIHDGKLDVASVIERFAAFMKAEHRDEDGAFIERQARLLFLSFLKPVINGTGHYAVEPETRGSRRMDVVVFYGNEEHIIELKIWRGEQAAEEGYGQLVSYLKSRGQTRGYLVSFADNKKSPREGRTFLHEGCEITEAVIAYRDKE